MTKEEFLKKVEEQHKRRQAFREKIRKMIKSRREKAAGEDVKSDAE